MATRSRSGNQPQRFNSGPVFMVFAVVALLVIVLGVGWLAWTSRLADQAETAALDLELKLPKAPNLPPNLPSPAPLPNPEPLPLPGPTPTPG